MTSLGKQIIYILASLFYHPKNVGVILVYHSISTHEMRLCIKPEEFERQMDYLAKKKFNVVSLDTLAAYRSQGMIPRKTVAITFDDGYRDNYTYALPVLQKYNFPAAIFLTTSDLGNMRNIHDVRFEILSPDELRILYKSGITIGAHSVTHPKLSTITAREIEKEVTESKRTIESILSVPCVHFAYPHGRYNTQTIKALKNAGFMFAYTTQDGLVRLETPPYQIKRNTVAATSFWEFRKILKIGRISYARRRPFLSEA